MVALVGSRIIGRTVWVTLRTVVVVEEQLQWAVELQAAPHLICHYMAFFLGYNPVLVAMAVA
jgi:hypothetical protein